MRFDREDPTREEKEKKGNVKVVYIGLCPTHPSLRSPRGLYSVANYSILSRDFKSMNERQSLLVTFGVTSFATSELASHEKAARPAHTGAHHQWRQGESPKLLRHGRRPGQRSGGVTSLPKTRGRLTSTGGQLALPAVSSSDFLETQCAVVLQEGSRLHNVS